VWHFCGKKNNGKIEKNIERALRIAHQDYTSTYNELLDLTKSDTMLLSRLKNMTIDVFKSLKNLNPPCLNGLYKINVFPYENRKSIKLVQPLRDTTTYGLRTLSYTGAKLWNDLPFPLNDISEMGVHDFKNILSTWEGPDDDGSFHYV